MHLEHLLLSEIGTKTVRSNTMEKKVSKCFDCPFCHELMSDYYCKIEDKALSRSDIYREWKGRLSGGGSPEWCPLKKDKVVISFGE